MPDFLDTLFYSCPLSFCSFFLSFIYFFTFSYSISIHFKSQAWILKVSRNRSRVIRQLMEVFGKIVVLYGTSYNIERIPTNLRGAAYLPY